MVHHGGSSHIGSVLSIVDILAVLYGTVMKYDCSNPEWEFRDRFILSKGHAGAGVYAVLAEVGFLNHSLLLQHCQNGSVFSGHVSHKNVPGVEFSTGSLGHGLPVAVGMALAAKIANRANKVYVLIGDGELAEGANWEAMLFAAHHKLNNLVLIIDRNYLQSMDTTERTLAIDSVAKKFKAFNWSVLEIDGHDHAILQQTFSEKVQQPLVVIAKTIKGKGVSYMENKIAWHYRSPDKNLLQQALEEVESN